MAWESHGMAPEMTRIVPNRESITTVTPNENWYLSLCTVLLLSLQPPALN